MVQLLQHAVRKQNFVERSKIYGIVCSNYGAHYDYFCREYYRHDYSHRHDYYHRQYDYTA